MVTCGVLISVSAMKGFDLEDFSNRWRTLFSSYKGYLDQATRVTLSNYASGKKAREAGSTSDDISGAARIAPLGALYANDLDAFVLSARTQTNMTHSNQVTIDCAEFFAHIIFLVLNGTSPSKAIDKASSFFSGGSPVAKLIKDGLASLKTDTTSAIMQFGQSCHTPDALPGIIHIVSAYENDFKESLIQAVMAGGDNAARAMASGMILGAHLGLEAIPDEWVSELKQKSHIMKLVENLL
ncbi:MAG: ADP-ribosylglycohydrolase family protein [Desulfobacteraceae bacterium]|jgi:ADP-ribosylglycohydrolase|nr:MAG: ADP-ribosylglycohydrolase family protein [Desulfobacteraceae bacterium]